MLVAERLISLRKGRKLRQVDIAGSMGLERTTYVKYEKNGIQPPNDMLVKLADYFNVSTDYLLGISDDPTPPGERLNVPEDFKKAKFAFHNGELEDLTQDEIDNIASYIKFVKSQRMEKGKGDND